MKLVAGKSEMRVELMKRMRYIGEIEGGYEEFLGFFCEMSEELGVELPLFCSLKVFAAW